MNSISLFSNFINAPIALAITRTKAQHFNIMALCITAPNIMRLNANFCYAECLKAECAL